MCDVLPNSHIRDKLDSKPRSRTPPPTGPFFFHACVLERSLAFTAKNSSQLGQLEPQGGKYPSPIRLTPLLSLLQTWQYLRRSRFTAVVVLLDAGGAVRCTSMSWSL